ncbi:hypothetical protein L1987_49538 [Smallanthus sonchifolius]|uniref:Uncharacterized protein n=1 Tax=Smallanthus sonchifolius TaxID=185202 RepID=A0ACB9FWL8_9ASTR|nr:hypothetical protein L1987_49538 [Smallanthus sonchifolius]
METSAIPSSMGIDFASKNQNVSNVTVNTTFKEEAKDTYQIEKIKNATCDSILVVLLYQEAIEGKQPTAPIAFYCELCRLHADPQVPLPQGLFFSSRIAFLAVLKEGMILPSDLGASPSVQSSGVEATIGFALLLLTKAR